MAICNLFRALSKKTGNVMMFSQYSEDLTQCFTQHDNYDVIPSRFVALNIDYSKLDGTRLGAKPRIGNLNVDLPTYLQNYFENGCAWLMGNQVGEDWYPSNWTPDVHSNLFWNFMVESGLISQSSVTVEDGQTETTIDTFKEVKYVGNIDIHSYEQRDGVGYSEIYCYIPNSAAESYYQINMPNKNISTWTHLPNEKLMIEGRVPEDDDILGTLDLHLSGSTQYYYTQNFGAAFTKPLEDASEETMLRYDAYPTGEDMFKFNTIVVLYNIMVRDVDANITVAYKDVPMAMFLTGLINQDGSVSNEVQKYSNCDDAYGSGTSYGLRVCTRYMITPNATTILTSEADVADQYAGFSRAMDKMAESQSMMDTLISDIVNNSQDIKDHLAMFKNYRVNIPYAVYVNEGGVKVPYWFVNGKNTGVRANAPGHDGKDGSVVEPRKVDGVYHWFIDGEDTGIIAEGTPGKNGFDGQYWFIGTDLTHTSVDLPGEHTFTHNGLDQKLGDFYINTDTGWVYVLKQFVGRDAPQWQRSFCLKGGRGQDGTTPEARVNPDDNGNLWWYVGNAAICRAQAFDGASMLCKNDIYVSDPHVGFATSSCKPGDIVVYVGNDGNGVSRYNLYEVGSTKFTTIYNNERVECYDAELKGNVRGVTITGNQIIEGKKATYISLNLSNGKTITFKHKRGHVSQPRFSSMQRSYACWDDVVYYRPGDEIWVEIPYNFTRTSVGGGLTSFTITPVAGFEASSYQYIFKRKRDTQGNVTKGYKPWTSNITFTVPSPTYAKMKATFGRFCRMGQLHLFAKYQPSQPNSRTAGLLHAVIDYKHKDQLRWELDPQNTPVTVQRHGLTFITPKSWSTSDEGNLDIDTNTAFGQFHKEVLKGNHLSALNKLIELGGRRTPLYTADGNPVNAKIWVKIPSRRAKAHADGTPHQFDYLKIKGGWCWRRDKIVNRTKIQGATGNKNGRVRYRLDWSSAQNFMTLLKSSKFGDNVGNLRGKVPYIYVAIFDKVGAMGYLYKVALCNRVPPSDSVNDIKIKYEGRIPYFKKTR